MKLDDFFMGIISCLIVVAIVLAIWNSESNSTKSTVQQFDERDYKCTLDQLKEVNVYVDLCSSGGSINCFEKSIINSCSKIKMVK